MNTRITSTGFVAFFLTLSFGHLSAGNPQPDNSWLYAPVPQEWTADTVPVMTAPADDAWWRSFDDSTLDRLIEMAETNNLELSAALSHIDAANQTLLRAKGAYFPTISASGSWTASGSSGRTGKTPMPAGSERFFDLGLSANWEIDVFGRVRAQAKAAGADLDATKADRAAVALSVGASVATTYFTIRTYQEQLEVALDHIDSQEKVLATVEARFKAGLASALDVSQASTVLLATKATIPGLESAIKSNINALALLCGVYADQLPPEVTLHAPLPDGERAAPQAVPADLLRRRPDIVAAEYQLRALAAQVGVAKKDFLPTLSISGQVGTAARKFTDLFGKNSLTYSVTPQISWTIFDGLERNRNVKIAEADLKSAVASYNQSVMSAVNEVEDNINLYASSLKQIELFRDVLEESRHQLDLAIERYKLGLSDFTSVANAEMTVLENFNSFVNARGTALRNLVSIYKALGGGWDSAALDKNDSK